MFNRRTFDRRTLFRGATLGVGGLYLAPFIRQLDAAAINSQRPARVLFFVQGNGLYPAETQPQGIERERTPSILEDRPLADHRMALSLEPLQPYVNKMTMIHGLSGRIARGSHNMGFAALGCWPMGKKDYGETVDAGMARHLGGIYRHVGLGVSNNPMSMTYNVTSAGKGKALPTLLNPVLAHQQFFAAGAAGDARKEFDVDTSLLDFMADDVQRMKARLHGPEREKLDRYLEAFESMSGRQSQLAAMADRIADATPALSDKADYFGVSRTAPTGVFDRLEAQFEIAAGTMIAGLTNTVTVSAGAGPDRIGLDCMASEIGKGSGFIGSHGIGHGGSAAGLTAAECHALIRRKCLEKLAKFIATLESLPEGDGTMMDNTLIVYLSDSAEGHHPVCEEWPLILIGDLGGRLKLGNRYLRYPWYGKPGHRTLASLYLSLLQAVGDKRESFGIPDLAIADLDQSGPLAELIV
ncbi:DUF1552 domain-containing protein [Lignipirellula cremea]|uniref:DUF1552 domain-containing protein n=1 Tax=Lignipirellula cremea TaxID=2528010 RepID=A0A518DL13_9BACT|nr:DUF1552 domain-containing protein [Lignipirellula cremea]QDU92521.1 hypothetical protein Pla8534_02690 [Lignipirellula cremea]